MPKPPTHLPTKKRLPPALDEGDQITFGLSQELPYPKGASTWVSASAVITVRPGESVASAKKRLAAFVEDFANEKCQEIISG